MRPTATVIGGGICGLLSALLLDKRNWNVQLVDESAGQPSPYDLPYVCSRNVSDFLKAELPELWDELEASGARLISIAEILRFRFPSVTTTALDEETSFLCTSRSLLHRLLFDRVSRSSVAIERGRVARVLLENSKVTGVETASGKSLASELVLDTTGAGTSRSKWFSPALPEKFSNVGPSYTSIARFFENDGPPQRVQFNLARGQDFRGGIYPLERGRFAVALVVPDSVDVSDARAFFDRAVDSIPGAKQLIDDATPERELQVLGGIRNRESDFYRGSKAFSQARGFFPIGDSVLTGNPIYGRGISLAVLQLKALVRALDERHEQKDDAAIYHHIARGFAEGRRYWSEGAFADRGEETSENPSLRALKAVRQVFVATIISQLDTNPDLTRRFLYNYQLMLPAWRITGPREYWTALTKLGGMSK